MSQTAATAKKRILIVEDEPLLAMDLDATVSSISPDYEVVVASSWKAAEKELLGGKFDLVISDFNIGRQGTETGFDVYQLYRRQSTSGGFIGHSADPKEYDDVLKPAVVVATGFGDQSIVLLKKMTGELVASPAISAKVPPGGLVTQRLEALVKHFLS